MVAINRGASVMSFLRASAFLEVTGGLKLARFRGGLLIGHHAA
jgi:hypothetical protein